MQFSLIFCSFDEYELVEVTRVQIRVHQNFHNYSLVYIYQNRKIAGKRINGPYNIGFFRGLYYSDLENVSGWGSGSEKLCSLVQKRLIYMQNCAFFINSGFTFKV